MYSGITLARMVRAGKLDPWLVDNADILSFFPCAYDTFKRLSLPTWQGMDYAVAGIGRWRGTSVAVYYKAAVLHLLDASVIDLPEGRGQLLARILVNNIYREQILPACLGSRTPFFLYGESRVLTGALQMQ